MKNEPSEPREIKVADFRKEMAGFVGATYFTGERFMIIRNSKPSAGLVTVDDLKKLEALDRIEKSPDFIRAAEKHGGELNVLDYLADSLDTE